MAQNRTTVGVCRLCLQKKPLTFEHIPPRRAFNDSRRTMYGLEEWLRRDESGGAAGGWIQQRGMGGYTLCEECNNKTGSWYAPELVRMVRGGATILAAAPLAEMDANADPVGARISFKGGGGRPSPYPVRFLKQIITMLLAANRPEFSAAHSDLAAFVLDRDAVGLPDRYRFFLGLFAGPRSRSFGLTGKFDPSRRNTIDSTEVAMPPFFYVLTIDSPGNVVPTANITAFADLGYDASADLELPLLMGFGHKPFPLDFRSRARLELDLARNEARAEGR